METQKFGLGVSFPFPCPRSRLRDDWTTPTGVWSLIVGGALSLTGFTHAGGVALLLMFMIVRVEMEERGFRRR